MSKPPVIVKTEGFQGLSPQRKEPIENLMLRISSLCKQKRIRPLEFFQDHDKLRKGFCSEAKFISAINQMKMDLDDSFVNILVNHFRHPEKKDVIC